MRSTRPDRKSRKSIETRGLGLPLAAAMAVLVGGGWVQAAAPPENLAQMGQMGTGGLAAMPWVEKNDPKQIRALIGELVRAHGDKYVQARDHLARLEQLEKEQVGEELEKLERDVLLFDVDRPAIPIQSLWTINPDGTGLLGYFGNRVISPATFMEARSIPGTTKILCTMTGHNGPTRGAIGVIDRSKGVNAQEAIENITPDVCRTCQ